MTGVTHECDFPPEANQRPRVTTSYIDSSVSSAEIDRQVTERFRSGEQLYGLNEGLLGSDPPDLIVTQDLCPVCAVSPTDFEKHMHAAGCEAGIVTLNPNTLEDVLESIHIVGEATNRVEQALDITTALRERLDAVQAAVSGQARPRVLTIEWLEPLMPGGHWMPEMVTIAGGACGLIGPGKPSRKLPWEEMCAENPDVVVLMPCGFEPGRGAREAEALWRLDGWCELPAVRAGEVYCVDGSAHFSRPGPRLVDGTEILARILHPGAWTQEIGAGAALKLADMNGARPVFQEYR